MTTALFSCEETKETTKVKEEKKTSIEKLTIKESSTEDTHSRSNFSEAKTKHIHLDFNVDFDKQVITGVARHEIDNIKGIEEIIFDSKALDIQKITLGKNEETLTTFSLTDYDELLGEALKVKINADTKFVNIYYSTTKDTEALGWMSPENTDGKKSPFLFTQGQAILTRTWIPCQDTPGNRITYSADVTVPSELMAVMSSYENPQVKNATGKYSFKMPKPVPVYLIALAVGDIEFRAVSDRTGVYSEPGMIEKAAFELADMEKMIKSAESLYGDYQWGRYDVIVLPPAFPFGGMENPVLTFATPTIIAGDRSLVALIAHELAHSWSGNLVTNATWNDFWLNEGFTVYFEERIMETIYDKEIADMLSLIEYNELVEENEGILKSAHPDDSHLKLSLEGRSPDEGMTAIAYVKGAFFLRTIEEKVGREKFDRFLKTYFEKHAFQTLTTEGFLEYLDVNLLQKEQVAFNIDEWVYGEGIPSNCVKLSSVRYEKVDQIVKDFTTDFNVEKLNIKRKDWIFQEWSRFLSQLPKTTSPETMTQLDEKYNFKNWGNSEIMQDWYVLAIQTGYKGSYPEMRTFLNKVGRGKFLEPIYHALMTSKDPSDNKLAHEIYDESKANYHAVTIGWLQEIMYPKEN